MYSDKRDKRSEDIIVGRNAVWEALQSGRPVDSMLIARGNTGGPVGRIVDMCRQRDIPVKDCNSQKLDAMCGGLNHQGVACIAAAHEYASVEDILARAQQAHEPPFLLIADDISDPHNLGAIIRSAECAGMHGVIIPRRNAAGLTAAVDKAACGALEYLPVARVANLSATADALKKQGIWLYGADMDGKSCFETDFSGPCALVIGSEGKGISRLLREKCDFIVSIPMAGHIESLNASVAAGILAFQAARGRRGTPA